jgi:hypothetical protein
LNILSLRSGNDGQRLTKWVAQQGPAAKPPDPAKVKAAYNTYLEKLRLAD